MTVQNQALSSTDGLLYTWVTASADWAASSFPGPGSALHIAVAMAPATAGGGGGGVTDHGALTGLNDDDHAALYALFRRPIQAYAGASNDFALADSRKFVTASHSSNHALRVRLQSALAWVTADELGGANVGVGALTITAEGGVTINGTVSVPQNGWFWLKRTGSNTWQCFVGGTGGGGGTGDIKADGTVPFAADQSMGGNQLTNVGTPGVSTDAATKGYVDTAVAGAGGVTAGNGITDTAGTFSVDAADGTLVVGAPGVKRAPITGDVTIADGSNVAAITADSIVNADINSAAAIAITKIAAGFLKQDGTAALTAAWDVGNQRIDDVLAISYEQEIDDGNSSTADTIDWTTSALHKSTLTGNCTYTFTAPQPQTYVQLRCVQDATGGRTVTLPVACVSLDGIVWQPNATASSTSLLNLYYDGTSYYYYGRSPDSRVLAESTTARTFGLSDAGTYVRTTNASATTLTVPPNGTIAFAIGTEITGIQAGAGQITFAQGVGVTINKPSSRNLKTSEQFSTWALKKVATNEWDLFGDLEVA